MKKLFTTLSVLLVAAATMAQVPSYVPTNGLVGYWPFNGNANDESGNGNNGTVNGATLTTDRFGNANSAYDFDGVNDYIDAGNDPSLKRYQTDFTISAWVDLDIQNNQLWSTLVSNRNGVNDYGSAASITGEQSLNPLLTPALILSGGANAEDVVGTTAFQLNTWSHFLVTFKFNGQDNNVVKFYLDGVDVTGADSILPNVSDPLSEPTLFGWTSQQNLSTILNGKLDDIGIWNRVLTEQEVTNLYTGGQPDCLPAYVPTNGLVGYWPFCGNANDESGNGNNGTVNGATLTTDRFGNANSAYDFDGVNDYINAGNDPSLKRYQTDFTISAWVDLDIQNNQLWSTLVSNRYNAYGSAASITGEQSLNPLLTPALILSAGGNAEDVVGTTAFQLNTWSHFLVTFKFNGQDNNVVKFYLDGVDVTGADSILPNVSDPLSEPTWFGWTSSQNLSTILNGKLDDIGIWNRVLSEQEITNLYTGCANPITATITPNSSTTICSGGFVQLTASAGDSYLWSNGETTQTITATQGGQYTVTVSNNDGCSDTSDPVTVTVNPTPNSGVTVGGATTFCSGGSVTLTSQASSGSYLWNNGETTQSITVNQTGNYSVTVTENGCSATSGSTAVTVNQTPTATITPQGNTTFCQGGFVVLQASGGGTYQWNTGSQASSINVSQGGTYSVIVTDNGCTDQTSQTVTVNPLPNVTLASINDVCENATAESLTGGMPMGGSYTVNGTPSTELNPSVTGSGAQTVAYEYTDNNGCTNSATQTVTVNATPNVTLSGLNTSYTPTDSPSTLSGTPTGGVFNGAGVSNGMFDPAVAGIGTHGIMYTVVDGNGCVGGQALCTTVDINVNVGGSNIDTDGGTIDVYPNPSNGQFMLELQQIEGVVSYTVYDARGREVRFGSLVAGGSRTQHGLDLSTEAKGLYTLQLQTANGTITQKLVKE